MAVKNADGTMLAQVIAPQDLQLSPDQQALIAPEGLSQCVRALMQNWRQGTVACKGRSDVAFSNKKPWKQKGTGRARAGSPRSPLWRKGGVTFGPQPRVRTLTVPKTLRRGVCNTLLWNYLNNEKVMSLNWVAQEAAPKTAHAFNALKQAGLADKKVLLFVTNYDAATHASFNNISNVKMLLFDQANAYHLASGDYWVFLNKDMDAFKEMVSAWI
ncbi:50S ribosomal protein L4 [Candidatus Dependentiae bacterium]|nr:50S ribosomal protein L4 [Candidatus Dependentiae bacterium]